MKVLWVNETQIILIKFVIEIEDINYVLVDRKPGENKKIKGTEKHLKLLRCIWGAYSPSTGAKKKENNEWPFPVSMFKKCKNHFFLLYSGNRALLNNFLLFSKLSSL